MTKVINLLKVILLMSIVESHRYGGSLEYDSSDCDSANNVTHTLNDDKFTAAKADLIVRNYNETRRNGEEYEISAKTVNDTATIENTAGDYQNSSSFKEDEDNNNARINDTATIENTAGDYQNSSSFEEDEDKDNINARMDFPYAVSILKKGVHYVSGALVDVNVVLSVAGEFYNVRDSLKLFRARIGSTDCKKGGTLVPLKMIEIHPYYIYGKPNFDISLVRLGKPVKFGLDIVPMPISTVTGKALSGKFMTAYWPRIVLNGKTLPQNAKERAKYKKMRISIQRLIPTRVCRRVLKDIKEYLHESSLCLKPLIALHSVCMPDAGAPVFSQDGLWGITSGWISPTCPQFAAPTIFTRLSSLSVYSWIGTLLGLPKESFSFE